MNEDVFGSQGYLARAFPGYQRRADQVRVSDRVALAMEPPEVQRTYPKILLAEAPTGVGKSVAYLVPAIKAAIERRERTLIATANIALQEQLIDTDLPRLREVLPFEFDFAIAKGFSNYACKAMLAEAENERVIGKRLPMFEEQRQLEQVLDWSKTTQLGDLSELTFEMAHRVKQAVSMSSEECVGRKCQFFEGCYPKAARKKLEQVKIVVTNYHLFCIDLEVRLNGGHPVLPAYDHAILDEAHRFPEIARSFFGRRLSRGSARTALELLDASGGKAKRLGVPTGIDPMLKAEASAAVDEFIIELSKLKASPRYKARLDRPKMLDGERVQELMRKAGDSLQYAAENPELNSEAREFMIQRASLCRRAAYLIRDARDLTDPKWVYYVNEEGFGDKVKVELVAEPIEAKEFLQASLLGPVLSPNVEDTAPFTVVAMSATLTVPSASSSPFSFFANQLGATAEREEIVVDSPFDYSRCRLIIPRGLPDQSDRALFTAAVGHALVETVTQARGRTLGLFTSYQSLRECAKRLRAAGLPYPILVQGEAPRMRLIQQFKRQPETVLLGTDSFWEGVDVPGESLSALFIDKLPFPNQSDPVLDALKERDPDGFFNRQLMTRALIKWRQGFGRLIRSVNDYGVVVCCDGRIDSKGYGKKFLAAIPKEVTLSDRLQDVGAFLGKWAGAGQPEPSEALQQRHDAPALDRFEYAEPDELDDIPF